MKIKLIILIIVTANLAYSQSNIQHVIWLGYYPSYQINSKVKLIGDFQLRTKYFVNELNTQLNRIGISYKLTNKIDFTIGIAYFNCFKNNTITNNEVRFWQELSTKNKIKKIKLNCRIRFEQRMFNNKNLDFNYNYFTINRLRNKLEVTYQKNEESKINYFLADEIMHQFKSINSFKLDQNRFSVGAYISLNKKIIISPQLMLLSQINNNKINNSIIYRINLIQHFN